MDIRVTGPLAREVEFYNKCHGDDGRFCEGTDGPGRSVRLRAVDKRAKALARSYHKNQADKQGKDYVDGHLTQVGSSLPPDLAMAGWLHDAIEDAGATPESLKRDGVSPEIIRIVLAVTTDGPNSGGKGELPYPERMQAVIDQGGPKAARVKLSDLSSNSDPFRPRPAGKAPNPKYADAIKQVSDYLKEADPVLYKDYQDRIVSKPGSFDWSQVRDAEGYVKPVEGD